MMIFELEQFAFYLIQQIIKKWAALAQFLILIERKMLYSVSRPSGHRLAVRKRAKAKT